VRNETVQTENLSTVIRSLCRYCFSCACCIKHLMLCFTVLLPRLVELTEVLNRVYIDLLWPKMLLVIVNYLSLRSVFHSEL